MLNLSNVPISVTTNVIFTEMTADPSFLSSVYDSYDVAKATVDAFGHTARGEDDATILALYICMSTESSFEVCGATSLVIGYTT